MSSLALRARHPLIGYASYEWSCDHMLTAYHSWSVMWLCLHQKSTFTQTRQMLGHLSIHVIWLDVLAVLGRSFWCLQAIKHVIKCIQTFTPAYTDKLTGNSATLTCEAGVEGAEEDRATVLPCTGVEQGELGVLPNWPTVEGDGAHPSAASLWGDANGFSVKFRGSWLKSWPPMLFSFCVRLSRPDSSTWIMTQIISAKWQVDTSVRFRDTVCCPWVKGFLPPK